MIAKLAAVAALAVAPVSAVPVELMHYPKVHQVVCSDSRGTAFEAGGKMISVTHVTENLNCSINGVRTVATDEPGMDFSTVAGPASGYKINCDGFKIGETYWAIGYAEGLPIQRVITLHGSGQYAGNGMALLVGYPTVIPGMSGGPIVNVRGEVVGTTNMYSRVYPLSLSQELKGTSLCRGAQA